MNRRRIDALAVITPDRLAPRINALPLWARDYIHLLETRVDPQGEIEELVILRDQNRALTKLVDEALIEEKLSGGNQTGFRSNRYCTSGALT